MFRIYENLQKSGPNGSIDVLASRGFGQISIIEGIKVLEGIKVVEIGQVLAAPFAAAVLSDLGAEVIKVEKPDGGDDARRMGPAFRGQDSMQFMDMNRNKLSVTIDIKSVEGQKELAGLLAEADILIHNLRPGVASELGLDGASLTAKYPRLIYCEISGFGDRGPLASLGGFEPIAQAFSGLISVNGNPGGPSARVGASVVDLGTALWVVIGAVSALYRRQTTGQGCVIRTSLLETSLSWIGSHVAAYLNQGREPQRLGTGHPTLVPYQAFATNDGEILIAAGNDRLFSKLCKSLGQPEWEVDPRFSTNRARLENRALIVKLISDQIVTRSKAEWFETFTAAAVPCAPVNSIPEALSHTQIDELEILQTVPGSTSRIVGLPIRFDGQRPQIRQQAPELGSSNHILKR